MFFSNCHMAGILILFNFPLSMRKNSKQTCASINGSEYSLDNKSIAFNDNVTFHDNTLTVEIYTAIFDVTWIQTAQFHFRF